MRDIGGDGGGDEHANSGGADDEEDGALDFGDHDDDGDVRNLLRRWRDEAA